MPVILPFEGNKMVLFELGSSAFLINEIIRMLECSLDVFILLYRGISLSQFIFSSPLSPSFPGRLQLFFYPSDFKHSEEYKYQNSCF